MCKKFNAWTEEKMEFSLPAVLNLETVVGPQSPLVSHFRSSGKMRKREV
jgi:hypothetical protein